MRKRMNYVPISRIVWVVNVWKAECLYRYIRSLAGDGYVKSYHTEGERTGCEFYKLCDHDDYPFDFKVWGHWVIFG